MSSHKKIIARIRSGGQTGTDRAALDMGKSKSYPVCGWCPAGGWAEDMTEPPGLRLFYPEMVETPSSDVPQRTEWNVRDSHATVIIGGTQGSYGTALTSALANSYERPFFIVEDEAPEELLDWLEECCGYGLTVNFAGPRESEAPGTYELAKAFIKELLELNEQR